MLETILKYSELITAIFGVLALIVKLTPTLKDDNIVLPLIKFLGKLTNYQEPEKK